MLLNLGSVSKRIAKTWFNGKSLSVIIPKAMAMRKNIYEDGIYLWIIEEDDTIIIKKL